MDTVNYSLNEDSPKASQPDSISLLLKPHQLASLYRMCMLDRDCGMTLKSAGIDIRSNIGILADCAGYGKTIVTLAMISNLRSIDTQWMPQAQTYMVESYGISCMRAQSRRKNFKYINTSLIVIPDNLTKQWEEHIEQYTELEYEIVATDNQDRMLVDEYDIIVCPATQYNQFISRNREYYWNRVLYDEADSIHIPNTEHVNTRFIWLITATYDNIPKRRNKGFLKNLFNSKPNNYEDIINEYFYPVVIKGQDQFVKSSFALIEPRVEYIACVAPTFVSVVLDHVSPRVLELVNAGDINGAILSLGGNIDTDRNIIDLVTKKIKNEITIIQNKLETLASLDINPEDRQNRQENLEKKLASLSTRNDALEKSISAAATSDCTICCDTLSHPTITPCCNNMFCAACLLQWAARNTVCPLCRSKFQISDLQTINNEEPVKKNNKKITRKDKTSVLIDIVKRNPNGRHLVFSGHSITFTEMGQILRNEGITYGVLTTTLNTEKTITKFRRGELQVILLDAENNGAGLDLKEATDVILYHQMRKSLEIQTVARAQRPGRDGQLRVWKLKYSHEY